MFSVKLVCIVMKCQCKYRTGIIFAGKYTHIASKRKTIPKINLWQEMTDIQYSIIDAGNQYVAVFRTASSASLDEKDGQLPTTQ